MEMSDRRMEANKELSISQVAKYTGLSPHALRFYEREGLLLSAQVMRGDRGHRRYSQSDVEWLDICIKLRASGMPLAQIKRFAELVRRGQGNEQQRLEILREHQRRVVAQMDQLKDCLDLINWKVGVYEEHLKQGTAQHLWTGSDSDDAPSDA
ncbi:MerR family transcriptional regulator [Paenibacillus rhizosphaerae]|uniref:MerR family transcriptional regulator n=2 Tax=Paenibacillus TaxID=44249 RepID=A0A1R1F4G9_9BACL|nr:MerR family transcriptional regulator [Paenibacillus rhizosphaerae]